MVFTEQDVKQTAAVFAGMYENKGVISELNATNTENMNGLAEALSARTGEEKKVIKGILQKAFKEYVEQKEQKPDTLSEAVVLIGKVWEL